MKTKWLTERHTFRAKGGTLAFTEPPLGGSMLFSVPGTYVHDVGKLVLGTYFSVSEKINRLT